MDRLPAVAIVLVAIGCTGGSDTTGKKNSGRVAAVEAAEPTEDPTALMKEWCDVLHEPAEAATFAYPALADGAKGQAGSSRWINVWATWCRPCVEELPRIEAFQQRLQSDGVRSSIELLAADDPDALAEFVKGNPAAKTTLRMDAFDSEALTAWLESLKLQSAGLPVHLFVDQNDRLRCARLGGVGPDDYPAVRAVLGAL